jgi:hypothetical protein
MSPPLPSHLNTSRAKSIDPDADWMMAAEKIPAAHFNPRPKTNHYIPAIPMEFIRQTLVAGDALGLLLVALAEMRMRGAIEITIGPVLWAEVGNPSKRVRARLLRQIAHLPESLCKVVARDGRPHLLKVGPGWPGAIK